MKNFSIIVAVDKEMGIGKSGALPWHLSRDMQRFKDVTLPVSRAGQQNAVVMGRKTWDSLPSKYRPLSGRLNVVVSSQADLLVPTGVVLSNSFDQALQISRSRNDVAEIFIIGGGLIFAEAISRQDCVRLYLTHIAAGFSCDVFFPKIPSTFQIERESEVFKEAGLAFNFIDYVKERSVSEYPKE